MKIIFGAFLLFSGLYSAQTSLVEPLKRDSLENFKLNPNCLIIAETEEPSIDSAIAKLYKMPVARPEHPKIYSSLNATVKSSDFKIKMPNTLDSLKRKKLATK